MIWYYYLVIIMGLVAILVNFFRGDVGGVCGFSFGLVGAIWAGYLHSAYESLYFYKNKVVK